jgi:hypothetical protein
MRNKRPKKGVWRLAYPEILMINQDDKQELIRLERINEKLSESLEKCRSLLDECRSKLAANGNEPERAEDEKDTRAG